MRFDFDAVRTTAGFTSYEIKNPRKRAKSTLILVYQHRQSSTLLQRIDVDDCKQRWCSHVRAKARENVPRTRSISDSFLSFLAFHSNDCRDVASSLIWLVDRDILFHANHVIIYNNIIRLLISWHTMNMHEKTWNFQPTKSVQPFFEPQSINYHILQPVNQHVIYHWRLGCSGSLSSSWACSSLVSTTSCQWHQWTTISSARTWVFDTAVEAVQFLIYCPRNN